MQVGKAGRGRWCSEHHVSARALRKAADIRAQLAGYSRTPPCRCRMVRCCIFLTCPVICTVAGRCRRRRCGRPIPARRRVAAGWCDAASS